MPKQLVANGKLDYFGEVFRNDVSLNVARKRHVAPDAAMGPDVIGKTRVTLSSTERCRD